jgi:lipopolysaccharide transport system permease protein
MGIVADADPRALDQSIGSPPEFVIEPAEGGSVDFKELWQYRGLLRFLVWRDLKVRYAQTVLGVAWAVLQPLLTTIVFSVIFGSFAKVPSDGVPYPVFSLAALVPWTYFSTALSGAGNSLVVSNNLITKVYFPRLVIPLTPVLVGLVDVAISMLLLFGMMAWYHIAPTLLSIVLVPLLLIVSALLATGVGAWLAALNIKYRDVKYVLPFLVQLWMYASPIVYPSSIVPERVRWLYALNPMVGIIEGFRGALLGTSNTGWGAIALSIGTGLLIFLAGTMYFRRSERHFADIA